VNRIDFRRAKAFVEAVEAGRWTSFGDVAEAAGNRRGAQAVGQWLMREGHTIRGVHRVLRANGEVPPGFRPAGAGVPLDAAEVRSVLAEEGVRFDGSGHAFGRQRYRPGDWPG
jgi:alkylated DNA nucleotide flippase Atl1